MPITRSQAMPEIARDENSTNRTSIPEIADLLEDQRTTKHQIDVLSKQMEDMMTMMKSITHQKETMRNVDIGNSSIRHSGISEPMPPCFDNDQSSAPHTVVPRHSNTSAIRLARLEFPRFAGTGVKTWLYKCEQIFELENTEEDRKVQLASIHMDDLAAYWHEALQFAAGGGKILSSWTCYKQELLKRFGEVLDDPMSELASLRETEGILAYTDKFDYLRTRVRLPENYLISLYLNGLRFDTQMHVRMFDPQTVRQCFALGRLYESAHPGTSGKVKPTANQAAHHPFRQQVPLAPVQKIYHERPNNQVRKQLNPEEKADKMAKGLCFLCDEKYSPAHFRAAHRGGQLFWIENELNEDGSNMLPDGEGEEADDPIHISLNAVNGTDDCYTIRVKAQCGKTPIFVLLDSGSTHNFLDERVALKLGCKVETSKCKNVAVAGGSKLPIKGIVRNFYWSFQGVQFSSDIMVIRFDGCDMVLGVQWFRNFEDMTWNFKTYTTSVFVNNRKLTLRGIKPGSVKEARAKKLNKLFSEPVSISLISVNSESDDDDCSVLQVHGDAPVYPAIQQILHQFSPIFGDPVGLPPARGLHDHRIPLLEGTKPMNQRPYRYSVQQKNEIDKIVTSMLQEGIIQNSRSSFASPVVLVKKKDGTWRLCVDFRKLNSATIKDRFPIPLIEDLMDELGGSTVFSKIDLRSGYHQVRMAESDIHKTAFKTHAGHFEYLVMPFGLTNAPATFQSLMNSVFQQFLRKFVLVFFDDILVYSPDIEAHARHLNLVLTEMEKHSLFAKRSKCEFACTKIEYLGHFISGQGISTDPRKIMAVQNWPTPSSVKDLRGFLGLSGYYRRFVKDYGAIARPLTSLLKKEQFLWSPDAESAFAQLKQAMCSTPVLALPDFSKQFVVETDACSFGIGAVLMQESHPLAYISKHLKGRQLALSIYEKELLAVIFAIQKWRHYLLSSHFIIRTDQRSLKYLLEQRLNTPIQQQLLPKLLEFSYEIQYKEGKENLAADALSRIQSMELCTLHLSSIDSGLLSRIQHCYTTDPLLQDIIGQLQADPNAKKNYSWQNSILRRKGKLVVGNDDTLKSDILAWLHSSPTAGHSGRTKTLKRIQEVFYWKGLTKFTHAFVRNCTICQTSKYDTAAYPGLLQPLPIPNAIWEDISMDFITGLPMSFGKSVIFVVVDRLSKAAHFIALKHPFTALVVAQAFLDNVFKIHGCPKTITSDRDAVFVSDFWKELWKLQGVKLNMSTAYHPQSDGQTEVVNRCLESYLRCMCSAKPHLWSKFLPLAEWWYNTSFHSATNVTPYEAMFGIPPPVHLPYLPGESKVPAVAHSLATREETIHLLKFYLRRAQDRMVSQANKHRSDRQFAVGDLVLLKLHPYRQSSVTIRVNQKISPKFFGPYEVLAKVGAVAYRLKLPATTKIHPVFHVSQLKKFEGPISTIVDIPTAIDEVPPKIPEAILERRLINLRGKAAVQALIQWKDKPIEEATWELLADIEREYPLLDP